MTTTTTDVGPYRLFARRGPRILSVGAVGPSTLGLNLHRHGGISVSGLPRSGGTTICWGRLRKRCEAVDADSPSWRDGGPNAWIRCLGPFMVRVGSDF